jgi:hypothetical protein
VLAARRAYANTRSFVRAARPRHIARGRLARRAFAGSFLAGVALLGLIGIASPSQFGQPGAATLQSGWPLYALSALITSVGLLALARRRHLAWLLARLREPLDRPLDDHHGFGDAVSALEACPAPLRTRFALSWVWGPVVGAVLGGTFAFSSAYFVVDAVLARFRVGWAQPVYALGFAALSMIVFAAAAGRMSTWRFATSVHKEVSTGYPA